MGNREILAVAAIAAICLAACSGKGPAAGPGGQGGGAMGPGAALSSGPKVVRLARAARKTLRPYVDQGGDVEASVEVAVYPDIGGKVVDLGVALGDSVKKGQPIASVDPSKPGARYEISPVTSPISGTVTSVPVDPGATVTTSTAIVKVGVIDELKVVVELPERDSAAVKVGMSAEVGLAALPGEKLAAAVSRVSPVLDATSRTREVTLKFLAKDDRVAAGMYASARIYIAPLADRIVIPASAVISRNGETYVFAVEGSGGELAAKKRVVALGAEVDGEVEARSGLSSGDRVVVEGQDQLSDGKKVAESAGSAE